MKVDINKVTKKGFAGIDAYTRAKSLRDLENEARRIHVGSFELENELKVRADVYSDTEKWLYIVKVTYVLNGDTRRAHGKVDMSEMTSPQDMKEMIRSIIVESLADKISAEVIKQNLSVVSSTGGDYVG